jgi:hypothetical protein
MLSYASVSPSPPLLQTGESEDSFHDSLQNSFHDPQVGDENHFDKSPPHPPRVAVEVVAKEGSSLLARVARSVPSTSA